MSMQPYSQGLLSGNGVKQNTSADMNVLVGGSPSNPDIVIATAPSGYKIVLDIVGQQAIQVTAPASNSRITSVVAYTDDLSVQSTQTNVTGSPLSCGLILVNGASGASPTAPSDSDIRAAITSDGATGSQAAYVVIANITVASSTTTITNNLISVRQSRISTSKIDGGTTAGQLVTDASGNMDVRISQSSFVQGTVNTTSGSPAYTPVNISGGPSLTFAAVAGKKYEITVSVSYISAPSGEVNIQVLRPTDNAPLSATTTIGGGNVPLVGVFEYTETTTTNRTLVIRMAPQATNATIRTDNPRIKVVQIG